jgi:hypothetical protein
LALAAAMSVEKSAAARQAMVSAFESIDSIPVAGADQNLNAALRSLVDSNRGIARRADLFSKRRDHLLSFISCSKGRVGGMPSYLAQSENC